MKDDIFEKLEPLEIPMVSPEVKKASIDAGLKAFKAQSSASVVEQPGPEKKPVFLTMKENQTFDSSTENNLKKIQEKNPLLRLIRTMNQTVGALMMKNQLITSTIAASVLVVTVLTHQFWLDPSFTENSATSEQDNFKVQPELSATKPLSKEKASEGLSPADVSNDWDQVVTDSVSEVALSEEAEESFVSDLSSNTSQEQLAPSVAVSPEAPLALKDDAQVMESFASFRAREITPQAEAKLSTQKKLPSPSSPMSDAQRQVVSSSLIDRVRYPEPTARDQFESVDSHSVKSVDTDPVSTFSIDVDTASYGVVRRILNRGVLPPRNAVRIEEMINYFSYDYPVPTSKKEPFKPTVAVYPTPWNAQTKILHIGIKGHQLTATEKPKSNLVLLLDVSGSMRQADKLPLLKSAFKMLVNQLDSSDKVSIVTYAGQAGTVLEPTAGNEKAAIIEALDRLNAGGSTAGHEGIEQAYALAKKSFIPDGVNRVILATDGDFNVGITSKESLKEYIANKRDEGVYLSILGFGMGNYNDALMQTLAQAGNGNAAYIDTLSEARKVLVDEASATLYPIANDVKIQVEFNPQQVAEYRLIGYETRALRREDFNNDKIDAGDIGAGHTVTALYEITPVGSSAQLVDPLRYQSESATEPKVSTNPKQSNQLANEYAFLKMRYKLPGESKSTLLEMPITHNFEFKAISQAGVDIQFASAVAGFGQRLRNDISEEDISFEQLIALANKNKGEDPFGYRAELVRLMSLAQALSPAKKTENP